MKFLVATVEIGSTQVINKDNSFITLSRFGTLKTDISLLSLIIEKIGSSREILILV
jgi:hypothetical protein